MTRKKLVWFFPTAILHNRFCEFFYFIILVRQPRLALNMTFVAFRISVSWFINSWVAIVWLYTRLRLLRPSNARLLRLIPHEIGVNDPSTVSPRCGRYVILKISKNRSIDTTQILRHTIELRLGTCDRTLATFHCRRVRYE